MSVPIRALPLELGPDAALEGAHADEVDALERELRRGGTVLFEVAPQLMGSLFRALEPRLAMARPVALRATWVEGAPDRRRLGPCVLEVTRSTADRARSESRRLVREADPRGVVVLPHVELLATVDEAGNPTREANDLAALVSEAATGRLLALASPGAILPDVVAHAFSTRGTLGPVRRERLRHVVLQREARKLGVEDLDPDAIADACPDLDVLALRRALEGLDALHDFDPRVPETREAALDQLRAARRAAVVPRAVVASTAPSTVELRLASAPPTASGVTRAQVDALAWVEVDVTWADGRVERVILGQRVGDHVAMRVPGRKPWEVRIASIRALHRAPPPP